MKPNLRMTWFVLFAAISGLSIGLGVDDAAVSAPAKLDAVSIAVVPGVPQELNPAGGGAPQANIQQAAAFAWQEFIALNWPAVNQSGQPGQRDQADTRCRLADPNCMNRPLVWHTFRSKVEIFPGAGSPPGYQGSADPSLGYDALPSYVYGQTVPACSKPSASAPWINLDETDQITLDSMFAGAGPLTLQNNSAPQLIRFLAKANRADYAYVAKNKWWTSVDAAVTINTLAYLKTNMKSPAPGSSTLVSLPNNTIEVKAGWRPLTRDEMASGRFHTARVRFYEPKGAGVCYNDDVWGLVALHIIQKTPSAPYFIYATFEQADNILTGDGKPVEDTDGNVQRQPGCRADQAAPCPTTPSVTLIDSDVASVPPKVALEPTNAKYCTESTAIRPRNQLYYQNAADRSALPGAGYICVNRRAYDIPAPIIYANKIAHAAIQRYNTDQGIQQSPWMYYKLVNVQYQPIDKTYAGPYKGNDPDSGRNPSSYHQANIVVETNRSLQVFSGGLVQSGATGANSDYEAQFARGVTGPAIHRNVAYNGSGYNMGGCMGCHGSQGQHQGGDFSVILANGSVKNPEFPAPNTSAGAAAVIRNRMTHVNQKSH